MRPKSWLMLSMLKSVHSRQVIGPPYSACWRKAPRWRTRLNLGFWMLSHCRSVANGAAMLPVIKEESLAGGGRSGGKRRRRKRKRRVS